MLDEMTDQTRLTDADLGALWEAIYWNENEYGTTIYTDDEGEQIPQRRATCGTCGLDFPDVFPSARCPYEAWHADESDDPDADVRAWWLEVDTLRAVETAGLGMAGAGEARVLTTSYTDERPAPDLATWALVLLPAGISAAQVQALHQADARIVLSMLDDPEPYDMGDMEGREPEYVYGVTATVEVAGQEIGVGGLWSIGVDDPADPYVARCLLDVLTEALADVETNAFKAEEEAEGQANVLRRLRGAW